MTEQKKKGNDRQQIDNSIYWSYTEMKTTAQYFKKIKARLGNFSRDRPETTQTDIAQLEKDQIEILARKIK